MDKESESLLLKELKDLRVAMIDMGKYWKRQTSLRWNFVRGVIYGLGFFIGSALLTASIIYILTQLAGTDSNFGRLLENIVELNQKTR